MSGGKDSLLQKSFCFPCLALIMAFCSQRWLEVFIVLVSPEHCQLGRVKLPAEWLLSRGCRAEQTTTHSPVQPGPQNCSTSLNLFNHVVSKLWHSCKKELFFLSFPKNVRAVSNKSQSCWGPEDAWLCLSRPSVLDPPEREAQAVLEPRPQPWVQTDATWCHSPHKRLLSLSPSP